MFANVPQNQCGSKEQNMTESVVRNSCETQTTPQVETLPPFPGTNHSQTQSVVKCNIGGSKVVRPSSLPISSSSETSPKTKSLEIETGPLGNQPVSPTKKCKKEKLMENEETNETTNVEEPSKAENVGELQPILSPAAGSTEE